MSQQSSANGGIGICGATFLVFLVLKLTDKLDWSWWWITAPLWMPVALVLVILIALFILAILSGE